MMKQSANSAVRFTSYQTLKDLALKRNDGLTLSNPSIMAIGAAAGVITVYSTMPFE
jgi:solute carrier family 25 citrate transporter 1